jgi:hypothetical protein
VARYYFNLVGRSEAIADGEGVELPDHYSEQAITRIIEEIRSEEPELFVGGSGWSIEVVDVDGRMLARFPL